MKTRFEVGKILSQNTNFIESNRFNNWQKRTLFALSRCRTAEMGGHIDQCDHSDCGKLHLSYNSCRNRHCPKCQGHKRELWMQSREEELLPVGYFHVVFTLPSELHVLALHKPKLIYSTLFKTAWSVIKGFGENPKYLGANPGMISILHTWGQNMSLHPHLHCIIPSGGVSKKGKWIRTKKKNKFLFPVKEMSKVFRALFAAELRKNGIKDKPLFDALFKKQWVIYAKKPFKNPSSVVEYLGRYTHKIAISNPRIKGVENGLILFNAKDYKQNGKKVAISLKTTEFIRRFAQHILPKGFVRIRHYGFLSSTGKRKNLKRLQHILGKPKVLAKKKISQHLLCPFCKTGMLKTVYTFSGRDPPEHWKIRLEKQNRNAQKNKC